MKKLIILLMILCTLFQGNVLAVYYNNALPEELAEQYPYRSSQTTVEYAPWYTLVYRSSEQYLQTGMNAGENCQVVGTIAFSDANPKHVIAGIDTNVVAISTDGGENWYYNQSDKGTHACMTAIWHPTDENIVYRVSNGYNASRLRSTVLDDCQNKGLFRSEDCGKTWERILDISMHTEYGGNVLEFDNFGNLYALTCEGLFKSQDDGDTWMQLNDLVNWLVFDIAISEDGSTILTGTVNGLYVSFDEGKTWEFRNGKQYYGHVTSIDIDPLNEKHWLAVFNRPYKSIAESYDYGRTWNYIDVDSQMSNVFKARFGGVRDDGSRYMYCVGSSGTSAYRYSKDNGVTWLNAYVDTQNGKGNRGTWLEGLAISRKYPDIVWYAFGDGMHVSFDGGVVFHNRNSGHGGQKCFSEIVTDNEGKIHFPGTDTGYFHTSTAYVSGEPFPGCSEPFRMWGPAIAISPHNPNFMLLGGGEQGEKVMYCSYDKGETWRIMNNTLLGENYTFIKFHKTDRNIIYTNVSTSYDGGKTWQKNDIALSAVSPINSDILLRGFTIEGTSDKQLEISYNAGRTWEDYFVLEGGGEVEFDKFDSDRIWVYQWMGRELRSFKGGELVYSYDFKDLVGDYAGIPGCFEQDPRDAGHLLISLAKLNMDIGYGIAESFDGGKTWTIVPGNPGNGWITMICFEERTNDIFINSYCGLVIYDSEKFKNYIKI